ncbi:MAG: peptide ABC transporter substrate-binding protein [Chlamydiae bacterium]|nr:peptide ABC transporter substrate-binding protein [Chlamydiota bacterium]
MRNGFILTLLYLCILFGCQKKPPPMQTKQVFRLSFPSDASTLDPRKNSDYINSTAHFMLFEGLTRMTPSSTHELAIADSIEISPDQKTYTFSLKETFWSDGTPLTADDFVYAWQTVLDPDFPAPNAHLFYPIKNSEKVKKGLVEKSALGIEKIDTMTFAVTLENQTPYFLELISFCPFFPIPSHIAKNHPDWADNLSSLFVTNGPFALNKWDFSRSYEFIKNERYWNKEALTLDKIEVLIIDNELTALNLFENHEIDFYGAYSSIPSDSIPKLQKEKKIQKSPVGATTFLSFNLSDPIFQNKMMRKALSLAINRAMLVENITQCDEIVASGTIPPLLKLSREKNFFKDHDTDLAKAHLEIGLKELGLEKKDLPELILSFPSNINNKRVAQAIQEEWRTSLGIQTRLEESEFKIHRTKLFQKAYQIALSAWFVQYNDQMNILDRFKLKTNDFNYPGFENKLYIRLLDESALATSTEERFKILEEAEEILSEETPLTPLYHLNCIYLLNERVTGLFVSPIGSLHFNQIVIN